MVDNDAETLSTGASLLQEKGFPVCPVNTAEAFAEALKRISPGVIIINTYAGSPITGRIMHEINVHDHCRYTPVICYFADEGIYLLKRKIEDGRMEYQSIRSEKMDTVLQAALG